MSSHYQSHKQQANSRIQAHLREAEMHRLAKQAASGQDTGNSRFSLFGAFKNLFSRQHAGKPATQKHHVLGEYRR